MKPDTQWSRRAFLQGLGYTSALGVLNHAVPWNTVSERSSHASIPTGFAYIGSTGKKIGSTISTDATGICVFNVRGDRWDLKQVVPSRSPVALALHPNRQFLYVANEIDEFETLPRGSVEAFKIDAHDGSLTLISRQPLSLSGTKPRRVAVSPNGDHLVVAIHGGGAYNVLPIGPDGAVGRVTQIFKEVGCGAHPVHQASAHPHTVIFDATGQYLLATDEGCDRISVFSFLDGRMMRTVLAPSRPVSGPGHLAIHPSGSFLYISNTLNESIDCYRWHVGDGKIEHQQRVVTNTRMTRREIRQLGISSSGRFLYESANEGTSVWEIDSSTGALSLIQQWVSKNRALFALQLSPDDRCLFVGDSRRHALLSISINPESGKLGRAFTIAETVAPESLVVRYV